MTAPAPTPAPFPYKTQPLPKQREALLKGANAPYFAYFMEQGTGKSKVTCDNAAFLYLKKKIDALIIVAPNGVHTQWALDQLPTHMSDAVPWRAHIWRSGEQRDLFNKRKELPYEQQEWDVSRLAQDMSVLAVLCVNAEALQVNLCRRAVGTFLTRRRCMVVIDEAGSGFTTPSAKRVREIMRWRDRAPYRRILEGVPAQDPFELYSLMRFLSPKILGYDTFKDMKEAHAEWVTITRGDNGREIKIIAKDRQGKKQYKNLEYIRERIAPHMYRCTKAEALPDLAPKQFHKRYFELSEEQVRMTQELMTEFQTSFPDGATVSAANKLTQYLRYQQIASGYCPPDIVYGEEEKDQPIKILSGPNPRLNLAIEELVRHKTVPQIVWTRFHYDIDLLLPRLRDEGFIVVTYDGRMTQQAKDVAKAAFQAGDANLFLGNSASGGTGLNLYVAEHVLYYVNYFGLRRRLQSEDRAHRMGTKRIVNYTDLVGLGSVDHLIVRALRNDMDVASAITGDPRTDWL